jgi:hypothetical protein
MGGRRRLRGGIPRLFRSHRTPDAYAYRGHAAALIAEMGIGPDRPALLLQVGQVAALWVVFQRATAELSAARARQQEARGRRPTGAAIGSLQHRVLAANAAYQSALEGLRKAVSPWK